MDQSISVVMPVRNAQPYLDAAVASILEQTHRDFEFVILDDGSTDGSLEALRGWAGRDQRIRLFEGKTGLGPAGSANFVVDKASNPIVARMDADDISHPDRLRRQLSVINAHPDASIVATLWEGIDSRSRRVRPRDRGRLAKKAPLAPFAHGSIMFHRDTFQRSGGYDASCDYWEDADLYPRLARLGRVIVMPETLYYYRVSPVSARQRSRIDEVERAIDRMYRKLVPEFAMGRDADPGPPERVLPRVFLTMGSTRLWDGRSPAVLRRLLRFGDLRWDWETASILVWATWGAINPASLRSCLRLWTSFQDFLARSQFPDGTLHEWRPARVEPAAAADPDRNEDWAPIAEIC